MDNNNSNMNSCDGDYKMGSLPPCAPLAASFTPAQGNDPKQYDMGDALTRGTLFPGLDLPFKNVVNRTNPYAGTPLGELMAMDFAARELQLYLDTHSDDKEAFQALRELLALKEEGEKRYMERFGPLTLDSLQFEDSYTWLDSPWPWEYSERTGDR